MKTTSFKDLIVWQKSFALTKLIYQATQDFPSNERFSITQQIRRAAVSIPSNIAEGYGRLHSKEYRNFLSIAYGSLCELETQILLCTELGYLSSESQIYNYMTETGKILYRMIHPKTTR